MHILLKRVFPAFVVFSLTLFSLQAFAQQDLVPIQKLPDALNLKQGPFIPMPTNHAQGQSTAAKNLASPFSNRAFQGSGLPRGNRFPGDLEYHGGPVVPTAVQHTIYVNTSSSCPPVTCWGNPIGFLTDLGNSRMIHLTDQYVGSDASDRYTVGTNFVLNGYSPIFGGTTLTDLDIAIIADAAAQVSGFGFGHIYHVFLVPGQDLCFDTTYSVCYSPDKPSSFVFCAYHSSATDSVGGPFLYSAEPFQNVGGCSVRPDVPNGPLIDSTNNVLSHETFETITDPEGSAWWNSADNGLFGQEIGDECSFLYFTSTNVYFGPNLVRLSHKNYAIQPEYNNSQHACSTSQGD